MTPIALTFSLFTLFGLVIISLAYYRKGQKGPKHIRVHASGKSLEECLRNLEQVAGLPAGDLSLKGDPREVTAWLVMRDGTEYFIASKTSDRWRDDPDTNGYIAGKIFETVGGPNLSLEQLGRMNPVVATAILTPHICVGNLHISRNCPGVYEGNRCTTCGDISNR